MDMTGVMPLPAGEQQQVAVQRARGVNVPAGGSTSSRLPAATLSASQLEA